MLPNLLLCQPGGTHDHALTTALAEQATRSTRLISGWHCRMTQTTAGRLAPKLVKRLLLQPAGPTFTNNKTAQPLQLIINARVMQESLAFTNVAPPTSH
jgi:hypothetical protein